MTSDRTIIGSDSDRTIIGSHSDWPADPSNSNRNTTETGGLPIARPASCPWGAPHAALLPPPQGQAGQAGRLARLLRRSEAIGSSPVVPTHRIADRCNTIALPGPRSLEALEIAERGDAALHVASVSCCSREQRSELPMVRAWGGTPLTPWVCWTDPMALYYLIGGPKNYGFLKKATRS